MSASPPAISTPPKTALEHFDAAATDYEAFTGGCTREVAEKVVSDLLPGIRSDSVILDNACGTGIVIEVLLRELADGGIKPVSIHGVDGAPNMVEIAANRFAGHSNVKIGLLFFNDALKGAREIYRTLKPGGIAVVTGWEDLGYPRVIREVQREVRPRDQPFEFPLPKQWFDPEHTKAVLRENGFEDVKLESFVAHWAVDSRGDLADGLINKFGRLCFDAWSDEERSRARAWFSQHLDESVAVPFSRTDRSKAVGIEMKAIVAIAYK